MTIGENIRRIRKERGLTQKQLGAMVGSSEAYIRAYESGRRNPKPASVEKFAKALSVNPEVLVNSNFDGLKAIHMLFQIFRQYSGELFEYKDENGDPKIGVNFGSLLLMSSWYDRYVSYMQEIEDCNKIKDIKKRADALLKAEQDFDVWMDTYPEADPAPELLEAQKKHDELMDKMGLNPKE